MRSPVDPEKLRIFMEEIGRSALSPGRIYLVGGSTAIVDFVEALPMRDLSGYPGGDRVERGLVDLDCGRLSIEALLVSVAADRLRNLGFQVPEPRGVAKPYEHALYSAIEEQDPSLAHSEYNALIGRIVSFAQAYEHALWAR